MRALRWAVALLMLMGVASAATGAEVPIPRSPTRWATDTTGFLQPQTVVALDARLRAYQSRTGHQVLVYVAPTTGDTPTEDWAVRAFARWKVGRKGLDDGLVLFVFPSDRKVRIEVGYGLEPIVPDATAARIIRDTIAPKLRAGRADEAVTAGVADVLRTIGGEAQGTSDAAQGKVRQVPFPVVTPASTSVEAYAGTNRGREWIGEGIGILIGLLITIGIIVLIAKLPSPKGPYIHSRRSGSGFFDVLNVLGGIVSVAGSFSGGGGGFSGGGGMSGGGGATGSW
jgi:uncharacterized protein